MPDQKMGVVEHPRDNSGLSGFLQGTSCTGSCFSIWQLTVFTSWCGSVNCSHTLLLGLMQLDQLNWCLHCSIVNSKLKNLILLGPLFVQHPWVNCVSPRVGREGGLLNPDNCPLLLSSSHDVHLQHGYKVYVGSAMCAFISHCSALVGK